MRKAFALLILIAASVVVFAQSEELENQDLALFDDDVTVEFLSRGGGGARGGGSRGGGIILPRTGGSSFKPSSSGSTHSSGGILGHILGGGSKPSASGTKTGASSGISGALSGIRGLFGGHSGPKTGGSTPKTGGSAPKPNVNAPSSGTKPSGGWFGSTKPKPTVNAPKPNGGTSTKPPSGGNTKPTSPQHPADKPNKPGDKPIKNPADKPNKNPNDKPNKNQNQQGSQGSGMGGGSGDQSSGGQQGGSGGGMGLPDLGGLINGFGDILSGFGQSIPNIIGALTGNRGNNGDNNGNTDRGDSNQGNSGVLPLADPPAPGSSFPYYSQADPRWSNERIGQSTQTIGTSGSVVSCIAMLVAGFGNERSNPSTINNFFNKKGVYTSKGEDSWASMKDLGFTVAGPFRNFDEIVQSMSAGNYCILNVGDHFVLATGIQQYDFEVMDPTNRSKKTYNSQEVNSAICFVQMQQ